MRRRRRRRPQIRIMLVTLAVAFAVILVIVAGFRIRQVEVEGNEVYTPQQIVSALIDSPAMRNSLLFTWRYHTAREEPKTPYLSSVQAKLRAPGKVRIIVAEKKVVAGILYTGTYYYFDNSGYVLKASGQMDEDVPMIYGMTIEEPVINQKLPAVNASQLSTMLSVAALVDESPIIVDSITFDDNNNIKLTSAGLDVDLGQNEYLEEKIAYLSYVYDEVRGKSGTLVMSSFTGKNDDIVFQSNEPETTAPAQSEANPEGSGSEQPAQTGQEQTGADTPESEAANENGNEDENKTGEVVGVEGFQVFDSSGTLRNDARVINGQVLDAYGNPIDGCYLNEAGHVIDAYMNEIDPQTGWPVGY